ncbi:MAG: ThiF family adenylyltransferase [Vicinamibacterales bacterium]
MIWYLRDPGRFRMEQDAVRDLERAVAWLEVAGWRIDTTLRLCLDAEIVVRDRVFPVTLRYGHVFPFGAPSVFPQAEERWSSHQWGLGGELCLEFGPDNWRPELTGADLLQSAERLLAAEVDVCAPPVPSRHSTTLGQDLRGAFARWIATESLQGLLTTAPTGCTGRATFLTTHRPGAYVITPFIIAGLSDEPWTDPQVPSVLKPPAHAWDGLAFTLPTETELPTFAKRSELWTFLVTAGFVPPADYQPAGIEFFLVHSSRGPRLFWLDDSDDSAWEAALVAARGGARAAADRALLASKTVAIVGAGSVGSKLATMLARAGVGAFVLLDDDVLLPENLVRHELDWSSMGEHKADALARHLALVAPGVRCTVRRHQLGGQEANTFADGSLMLLSESDLIVDATASPEAFNILSGVVAAAAKPLVWAEVFAGGIGGLVARARPALDPAPQMIRSHIAAWCAERGVPAPQPGTDYEALDQIPLIADDADVAVMAAHGARLAIDLLLGRNPSWFPASVYVVGLAPAWLFTQPFEVHPIDVGRPVATPTGPIASEEDLDAIFQLISSRRDHTGNPSGSDR